MLWLSIHALIDGLLCPVQGEIHLLLHDSSPEIRFHQLSSSGMNKVLCRIFCCVHARGNNADATVLYVVELDVGFQKLHRLYPQHFATQKNVEEAGRVV